MSSVGYRGSLPGSGVVLEVVAAVRQQAEREDRADHGHRDHRSVRRAAVGAVAAAAAAALHLLAAERAQLPPLDLLGGVAVRPGQARRLS